MTRYTCPFCSGTKTLPYLPRTITNQDCTTCDKNGTISEHFVKKHELQPFVKEFIQ